MPILPKLLLGAAGLAAIAGIATAAARDVHVLNVVLPDGSVEHIRYTGDVAPRVMLAPAGAALPVGFLGADDPFAAMERTMAAMEASTQAMLRQAALLGDGAAPTALPAGTVRYSFTSFSSGDGAGCTQSMQVTSFAPGEAPKVVRRSTGDCRAMDTTKAVPTVAPAAAPHPAIVPVRYEAPTAKPARDKAI